MSEQDRKTRVERRETERHNVILSGRFRGLPEGNLEQGGQASWFVSHISNVSREGFCLALPDGQEAVEFLEFEYHYHERTVAGKAKLAWKDSIKNMAGYYVLEYRENSPQGP